jgi:cytochrome bd-type quinol oxidase subunit 1
MVVVVAGIIIYGLIIIYPLCLQPFFNPIGNTIWAVLTTIIFVCYLIGLPIVLLDTSKASTIATVWILFVIFIIVLPIIIGFATYKRGRKLWAIREDEDFSALVHSGNF